MPFKGNPSLCFQHITFAISHYSLYFSLIRTLFYFSGSYLKHVLYSNIYSYKGWLDFWSVHGRLYSRWRRPCEIYDPFIVWDKSLCGHEMTHDLLTMSPLQKKEINSVFWEKKFPIGTYNMLKLKKYSTFCVLKWSMTMSILLIHWRTWKFQIPFKL